MLNYVIKVCVKKKHFKLFYINPEERVINLRFFFFFRNLGIGPIIRDAIGFPCLFIKLTTFDWKKKIVPSFFTVLALVLRIIALWTSPFCTFDVDRALLRSFCIDTIIISPRTANRLLKPLRTLIHFTVLAPELSATFKIVCCWIIFLRL